MDYKYYIPERFEKEIVLHAIRVLKANLKQAPIMLAIDGPTGEGKTYQCETVLKRIGCKVFSLSASQFESKNAGEPAERIRKTYDSAIEYIQKSQENFAALLIDDADVAFGNWGDLVQYTVNTQGVIGELMNIANMPIQEGITRIPIFLTGNDLKKLYAPLRRTGRMDFFYWEPDLKEKATMIYYLFDFLSLAECEELVSYVNSQCQNRNLPLASISFYSAIASHMYDNELWSQYLQKKRSEFNGNLLTNIKYSESSKVNIEKLKSLSDIMIKQIALSQSDYTNQTNSATNIDELKKLADNIIKIIKLSQSDFTP